MDEDAGVRAPVTRLRRRLSVEQSEESKSPAVNTPTKKRGGRRGKPDLELIDENTPDNTPNIRNKKTTAIESVEDKVTPSRRTTRIKSNTSIISDIATNVGSPRAVRAARRASQAGSDSEAPLTPLRQTRKTRRDSTSSVETAETQQPPKSALAINEVIVEEPENNERKSISNLEEVDNTSPSSIRKSPRLANKKTNQNDSKQPTEIIKEDLDITPSSKKAKSKKSIDSSLSKAQEIDESNASQTSNNNNNDRNKLSESSSDLLRELAVEIPKYNLGNLNKSATAVEKNDKRGRKRTKSWTTLTVSNESNFYSDNESTKKKIGLKENNFTLLNNSGSGEASMTKNKQKKEDGNDDVENIDHSVIKSKNELENENNNVSNIAHLNSEKNNNVTEMFQKEPSHSLQTLVYIEEDSDSNVEKNKHNNHENGDQCVPVIKHPVLLEKDNDNLNAEKDQTKETNLFINHSIQKSPMNDTCEPMDVDESIRDNLLIDDSSSTERKSIANSSKLKRIVSEDELNNSKRKTSISQNFEKSGNENKSTLILSQLKDTSNVVNIDTKSPAQIKKDKSLLTTNILNVTQENEVNRKNISLNCVTTSTPLQQKNLQKLPLQVNSSLILANDNSKDLIEHLNQTKTTNPANEDDEEDSSGEKSSIEVDRKKMKETKKNDSKNNANQQCNLKNDKSFNEKNNQGNNVSKNYSTKVKQRDSDEDSESDNESLNIKRKIKKGKTSTKNISATTNESINEKESDSESQENNSLVDDEADDAGDDYESGDSQDESEREYELQNQVVDKGETLTSEEDISDDSDYEKDSFIVSSDEEDNDLLDGSGDDLSMTDDELKMTAKSKEKFNERKKKEQKKASKEMYEARHKINTSGSAINKIKKHQKISSSESEEESIVKPRNANKMRLDSTTEESMLELKKIKKKTKRLSESVCEQSILNEKEITIANGSLKENDPLLIEINSQPKTPQKGNSSVAFVNSDELNKSELTKTQTEIDPLNDSSNDGSLTSEDESIMQNYDSILENLNKSNKIKAKTCDISLNLDKKAKKQKTAVVDELNLTQVRSSKKKDRKLVKEAVSSKIENQDDGSSSDSIDLRLLFSDESNDSEEVQNRKKDETVEEKFIPLKRTDAKTDITEDNDEMVESNGVNFYIDTEGTHASKSKSLDTSLKNKRKTFVLSNDEADALDSEVTSRRDVSLNKLDHDQDETDFPINKSLNWSTTKTPVGASKKSKGELKSQECNSDSEAPLEVSYQKERRSSKVKDMEITQHVNETDSPMESSLNESVRSAKKKKNKQKHESTTLETENPMETSLNMSASSTKKKKNKNINESATIEPENPLESSLNLSVISAKKKKNRDGNETSAIETESILESSLNKSISSGNKKKNKDVNEAKVTETENILESSLNKSITSAKKKKNKDVNEAKVTETENILESSLNKSITSAKKKKNKDVNEATVIETENISESSLNKSITSAKKKKNKDVKEVTVTDDNIATMALNTSASSSKKKTAISELPEFGKSITTPKAVINTSINKTPGSHKKETSMRQTEENAELSEVKGSNIRKRKRKSSHNISVENTDDKDGNTSNYKENDAITNSQKKKRKISLQKDDILAQEKTEEDVVVQNSSKVGNKIKTLSQSNKQEEASTSTENAMKRKRKQREDEDDDDRAKVFNSFNKHVPRLPPSILNQLDENPHRINAAKKAKVLSTTQFLVEETKKRKNKPSNYLEESIYLNDYRSPDRKQKKHLSKAKVLPFVPTAVTSGAGCTTNFKITVLPKDIKFVAQSTNVSNFKQEALYCSNRIKRQGTYELYKRNRNVKLSKF